MKLSFKTFAPLALAAFVATPAAADGAMEFAFEHFNQSADRASDIRHAPETAPSRVTISGMGQSPLGAAVRILNQSADTPSDLIGVSGFTSVPGEPAHGADIFRLLEEQSRGEN